MQVNADITILISLFITLALPRIVSAVYYDPGKEYTVGTGDDAYIEFQLNKDKNAFQIYYDEAMGVLSQ